MLESIFSLLKCALEVDLSQKRNKKNERVILEMCANHFS